MLQHLHLFLFFNFLTAPHGMQDLSSNQGFNLLLLQWKHKVLVVAKVPQHSRFQIYILNYFTFYLPYYIILMSPYWLEIMHINFIICEL